MNFGLDARKKNILAENLAKLCSLADCLYYRIAVFVIQNVRIEYFICPEERDLTNNGWL